MKRVMGLGRWIGLLFACLAVWLSASGAQATEAPPLAQDPVVEARLVNLAGELRCLVCQNESLASSRADLAHDLREEIREQIRQGKTDQQIKDYLVARYGDFVLYRPPVQSNTWLLWGGPFLFLLAGLAGLLVFLRQRLRSRVDRPLSEAEHQRAAELLAPKE